MPYRSSIAFIVLLALTTAATAADLYSMPDAKVAAAALSFRQKSFKAASEAAAKAPPGGEREFILGLANARLENFEESAHHLDLAANAFPLLADYALYNEARVLHRIARFNEALPPLQRLIKQFPSSPLIRPALQLQADTLFELSDFSTAYTAYQKFIEKFPSGTDSLSATYKSAICLEQLGNAAGAVAALRNLRLKYPASTIAAKAENDLLRLAAKGIMVTPDSTAERLRCAATLYDLKKFEAAARILQSVPLEAQPAGTADKYLLKAGQALFKARRYKEAEASFTALLGKKTSSDISDDAGYWLAKTLDKSGREEEAVSSFLQLAATSGNNELADKALLEASLIRKGQKKNVEALSLLKRILAIHPSSVLKQTVTWGIAWGSYQAGEMKPAAEHFRLLVENDTSRDKALYWYGRALAATGDLPGAQEAFSTLQKEYPFGFYAQSYQKETNLPKTDISFSSIDLCELLPIPTGYERVKALITFGLFDEARKELSFTKKKQSTRNVVVPGMARLYLEMEDYNGAYNLLRNERPTKFEKDTLFQWGICFPRAFRDHVARLAAADDVPESLVYAIIRAESSYSPTALSPVGAVGLMQLMPSTAAAISRGSKGTFNADLLTSPETNIRFGVRHLRDLLDLYKDDYILAIAAYNAGAGTVNRWRKAFGELRDDEFIENIPYPETREYVKKVLASIGIYSRMYKLDDPTAPPPASAQAKDNSDL